MSLHIIASEDAKALTNKLKESLQSCVGLIETFTPESFLKSKAIEDAQSVRVIFLTTLSWQELQRFNNTDLKRLVSDPEKTVVLYSCTESVKSAATEKFDKEIDKWTVVGLYEASAEEWYNAEARIKYRLSELENGEVKIPAASQFILKPDTLSSVSETLTEVLIILFNANPLADVETLHIKVCGKTPQAKKIQSNVWSFSVTDLEPGDHEIRVRADEVDLGTNTLRVEDRVVVMKKELRKLIHDDPERFLADLLGLDRAQFDLDLEDYIRDSGCIVVLERLLQYGDEDDHEYSSFLEFCKKLGLESCVNFVNKVGRSPGGHSAAEIPRPPARRISASESEEFTKIGPSFKNSVRDSGRSSCSGSSDSVDCSNTGMNISKSPEIPRKFTFKRPPRPYAQINDDEVGGNDPYNRPWDGKTILPNRSAKAWSADGPFLTNVDERFTTEGHREPTDTRRWEITDRNSTNL